MAYSEYIRDEYNTLFLIVPSRIMMMIMGGGEVEERRSKYMHEEKKCSILEYIRILV